MEKVAIQIREPNGTARIKEPVGLGIPVPKGTVRNAQQLALMDGDKPLTVQLQPLAHWPDGSIRWVHASTLVDLAPNDQKDLVLANLKTPSPSTTKAAASQTAGGLQITTATGCVILKPDSLAWQVRNPNNEVVPSAVILSDDAGAPCTAKAESNWEITHKGPVFVAATLKGQWIKQTNEPLARFECELRIFLETGLVQVELVTHNPKRARHPGGLWDLGDPGSVHFRELAVETTIPGSSTAKVTPQATDESPSVLNLADFNLYQDSSGGENWQSRNHVDANGEVTAQFCGYRLTNAGKLEHEGKRANPLVSIQHDSGQLELAVPHFWQSFPTSLRKEGNKVTVGLFPKESKKVYELQGGERKTLRCLMSYQGGTSLSAMAYTPLAPIIAPECYERAEAFPWFKANTQPGPLDHLIAEGLEGESNFFAKREVIDEFGWRNFGDIFADHETLYQAKGEEPFISHYNNQYDAIYGFARQFALTGDRRWFELMDDLASHVADIDIYHTEEDRAEYNNGLFWHTDHYLDAHTATHRTFSKHNDTSSTPGQTGGGPAAEHCYTTGLLYHYLLTGAASSKEAALKLAGWMVASHEGTGGILEALLTIKNQDLPKLKALVKGQSPTRHRYPFTRGTGNYLTALIDASILEPNKSWLSKADTVIRATIHPKDNIVDRNLLNVETGWSYLILLSAIVRYLYVKRTNDELDDSYQHAADCFMAYAEWMRNHESLFLVDPEQLEFPNHTWVAQDIRKAMLMFQAAEFATEDQAKAFQNTGENWLTETCETLKHSDECEYSRILVILMQNYGPHINAPSIHHSTLQQLNDTFNKSTQLNWASLMSRILMRLGRGIITFSPGREKAWLDARLNRQ
ncbi:hypothetical protein [Marinobacter sp. DY40_1A1]|uniref:RIFT barrel domain-containing protein n=1 Tax=Marinobacter sp. DY40_1A1 TaxID=2583229 RepID=UPI001904B02B|nr:hypothetical protein [Marinobacter sp. DY40_1A1]MBK1885949.1 hypothetical protein [Marinobacter sp. DY40_1A1]